MTAANVVEHDLSTRRLAPPLALLSQCLEDSAVDHEVMAGDVVGEAANTISRATSSGVDTRPVEAPRVDSDSACSASTVMPWALASVPMNPSGSVHTPVLTGPGEMVMARTPWSPNWAATALVSAFSAPLAAA